MFVSVSLVPSDSYAEMAKEAKAAEGDLLITNFALRPLRPIFINLAQTSTLNLP